MSISPENTHHPRQTPSCEPKLTHRSPWTQGDQATTQIRLHCAHNCQEKSLSNPQKLLETELPLEESTLATGLSPNSNTAMALILSCTITCRYRSCFPISCACLTLEQEKTTKSLQKVSLELTLFREHLSYHQLYIC